MTPQQAFIQGLLTAFAENVEIVSHNKQLFLIFCLLAVEAGADVTAMLHKGRVISEIERIAARAWATWPEDGER